MAFDFTAYMKGVAEKLKDLATTSSRPNFSRVSSISKLEEFLQQQTTIAETVLIVMDNRTGKLSNFTKSENIYDDQFHSFFIVKHVELNNFDEREEKIIACIAILFKIIARMHKHKRDDHQKNNENGLADLDVGSFTYDTIGPIGDGFHGISANFTIMDPAQKKLVYDSDDWNE